MIVDSRILDTDYRFRDYCQYNKIIDPFKEDMDRFSKRCHQEDRNGHRITIVEIDEDKEWEKRRDDFLKVAHTFRIWDFHFWMDDWEKFQRYGRNEYVNMNIYMPCDLANRQCSMFCAYFGKKCPRENGEELKSPIPGLNKRWEYKDDE